MKRYDLEDISSDGCYPDNQLVDYEDGDWVKYEDVQDRIKELKEEIQQLENMRDDELLED